MAVSSPKGPCGRCGHQRLCDGHRFCIKCVSIHLQHINDLTPMNGRHNLDDANPQAAANLARRPQPAQLWRERSSTCQPLQPYQEVVLRHDVQPVEEMASPILQDAVGVVLRMDPRWDIEAYICSFEVGTGIHLIRSFHRSQLTKTGNVRSADCLAASVQPAPLNTTEHVHNDAHVVRKLQHGELARVAIPYGPFLPLAGALVERVNPTLLLGIDHDLVDVDDSVYVRPCRQQPFGWSMFDYRRGVLDDSSNQQEGIEIMSPRQRRAMDAERRMEEPTWRVPFFSLAVMSHSMRPNHWHLNHTNLQLRRMFPNGCGQRFMPIPCHEP